ncbi:hypothetical protein FNV43_RR16895 [Rhamnella rubrinervis]|uniref:Uncharacterized protein n=1 Tax=Rhamnella rubrinervis TaxID=2594499 RepID=A0A8K0GZL7_9ROSA|nr:hypothetical protein FNV43_RR16895 [Rhamnella rubrinervis]
MDVVPFPPPLKPEPLHPCSHPFKRSILLRHYHAALSLSMPVTSFNASDLPQTFVDSADTNGGVYGDGQEDKSERKKNSSTSSRGTRKKRENINGALMSFINVYAKSARKRNEILEHKVASSSYAISSTNDDGTVSSKRNDEDEDFLNQCFEILNTMDEIDGDSYSKAIKLMHDDVT